MKKLFVLIMALMAFGCSSDSSEPGTSLIELTVTDSDAISSKRVTGEISSVGEVDRYFVNLAETGRDVQIKCTSDTLRPDVDLLVNVYEMNSNGELVMVAGDHAVEDGLGAVSLKINVYVDEPKKLYINVRDLMDDDSSTNNPYYLSASYEAAADGNGSFESSVDLTVDGDAARDVIGSEDDADCFHIQAAQNGVYDILVDFDRQTGSGVTLQVQVFDADGNLVEARDQKTAMVSHLIHYLEAGDYYVVINDKGKDDFDNLSYYEVSVDILDGVEAMANDTPEDATVPASSDFAGSIDYYEDLDIYTIDSNVTGTIKVMDLGFTSDIPQDFLIEVYEENDPDEAAFSHEYTGGESGDGNYMVTLKLENSGSYYLVIRPVSGANVATQCPYSVSMNVNGITDDDEAGDGNNVESDAIDLSLTPSHTGKVSYRGDRDWYEVSFAKNASTMQVLSLNLDIPVSETVQYAMKITCSDPSLEKIVFNSSDDQRNVDLKTGLLVPAGSGDVTYAIKVYDFQDDNGDEDGEFTLSWSVASVPSSTVNCPKDGGSTTYHNENDESNMTGAVTIEYPDTSQGTFPVDTQTLDLGTPDTSSLPVTIQFPWISGYIDYQGDEDWFSADLNAPLTTTEGEWYYTINVEFYASGSDVEYTWEYLPDSNGDGNLTTEWCSNDTMYCINGIQAAYTDTTLAADLVNHDLTSDTGNVLWLRGEGTASVWDGTVYFRISDFNYLRTDSDTLNTEPDDDWGYDAPYYFRVTLEYHEESPPVD